MPRKPPESLRLARREALERLYGRYTRPEFHGSDPVEFPHRFTDPWDQEAVGLFAASMAYGGVIPIRRAVETLLATWSGAGLSPSAWVRSLAPGPGEGAAAEVELRRFSSFRHRLYVGADVVALGRLLARSWAEHGSLGAHFAARRGDAADLGQALNGVMREWKAWAAALSGPRPGRFFFHLLAAPRDGSACKRWCMYLRWMVRRDAVDLGLWGPGGALSAGRPGFPPLAPALLLLPLDTHSGRISRYIGLTKRKTLNWKAVEEVTAGLRRLDPSDPARYDFALARLGILKLCRRAYRAEICEKCDLVTLCHYAARRRPVAIGGGKADSGPG